MEIPRIEKSQVDNAGPPGLVDDEDILNTEFATEDYARLSLEALEMREGVKGKYTLQRDIATGRYRIVRNLPNCTRWALQKLADATRK